MSSLIETSGIDTSDATATASQILSGYTAYSQGEKLTGTYAPTMFEIIAPVFDTSTNYLTGTAYHLYQNNSGVWVLDTYATAQASSSTVKKAQATYGTILAIYESSYPYVHVQITKACKRGFIKAAGASSTSSFILTDATVGTDIVLSRYGQNFTMLFLFS